MEKSRIAVLGLLGVVAMIAGLAACQNISCSALDFACPDVGDWCTGDFTLMHNDTKDCAEDKHCCAFPLICVNGKCVEDTRDADCNKTEDCKAYYLSAGSIECIKNKCIVQMNFNDSCREDDQCSGKQECMCGDHKCNKEKNEIGRCSGLKIGDECTDKHGVYECGANSKCVGGVCKAVHAAGEDCESDNDCDIYSICVKGKCIDYYSVKKGETCRGIQCCEEGLYCDVSGGGGEGVCKEARKNERVSCSKNEDCSSVGEGSTCTECDYEYGGFYCSTDNVPEFSNSDCASETQAAYKCFRENYCSPVFTFSVDTCAQSHCIAETNAYFACSSNCEDQKHQYGAKCVTDVLLRYCPLLPSWLRLIIAITILLAILIVVLIAFGVFRTIKKKNAYSAVPSQPEN